MTLLSSAFKTGCLLRPQCGWPGARPVTGSRGGGGDHAAAQGWSQRWELWSPLSLGVPGRGSETPLGAQRRLPGFREPTVSWVLGGSVVAFSVLVFYTEPFFIPWSQEEHLPSQQLFQVIKEK